MKGLEKLHALLTFISILAAVVFAALIFLAETAGQLKILSFLLLISAAAAIFLMYRICRRMFTEYCTQICNQLDAMIDGRFDALPTDEDTLEAKLSMKLEKLSDVTSAAVHSSTQQKEEVQQIVSDIAHQLKTPITNITLYSTMLENDNITDKQRKTCTSVILSQTEKLEFLVDALAKMSRLENRLIQLDIQPCRIFDTIFDVVSQAGTAAEHKNIDLNVHCNPDLRVLHDRKWTAEALFNIVDNAVKYTADGGHITIRVEPWEIYTKIEIEDDGIGINPDHLNDIFQRFFREKKVSQANGLGIGLYLSRQIISMQNGFISVVSAEGKGSTFSVFLPNPLPDSPSEQSAGSARTHRH